jgi:hypothetical protein
MTTDSFPIVDVTTWEVVAVEQRGSKPYKRWLRKPDATEQTGDDRVKWLFKPRTIQKHPAGVFPMGDDWAEKVAGEIALGMRVPAASIEFAWREGVVGTSLATFRATETWCSATSYCPSTIPHTQ